MEETKIWASGEGTFHAVGLLPNGWKPKELLEEF